jgi:hypothetical protein
VAILVLLVLAALWAAVLIPPVVRARNGRAVGGSAAGSAYRLDVIRPATRPGGAGRSAAPGNGWVSAAGMSPSQKRRRDILVGLGGAAVALFLLAVVTGVAALWVLQLLADVLLVGYILLLVQIKNGGFAVPGRGPAARTIRAVPHRAPLAPVGGPPPRVRQHDDEPYLPAAYGRPTGPPARAERYRSA